MRSALQRIQHFLYQIVDIKKFQLRRTVIDGNGKIVGNIVTKRSHGAVVIWTAPFPEKIREAIDKIKELEE